MQSPYMQGKFEHRCDPEFDVDEAICKSYLAQIKKIDSFPLLSDASGISRPLFATFKELLSDILLYARKYESRKRTALSELHDELDKAVTVLSKQRYGHNSVNLSVDH